jgi:hypothetical protein
LKALTPSARRVAERDAIQLARPCPSSPGRMASRLTTRPHSSLGNLPPVDYAKLDVPASQTGRNAVSNRRLRAPSRCSIEPGRLKWPNRLYSYLDEKRGSGYRSNGSAAQSGGLNERRLLRWVAFLELGGGVVPSGIAFGGRVERAASSSNNFCPRRLFFRSSRTLTP